MSFTTPGMVARAVRWKDGPAGEVATVTEMMAINNQGVIAANGEWTDSPGFTVKGAFRLQPVKAE